MSINNNIYRINAGVNTNGLTLKSVYIPSIHRDYDVNAICNVFHALFGTVTRIDRIEKTEPEREYQSMFVYYHERVNTALNDKNNRVYPGRYVQNRQFLRRTPIGPKEFWVVLPNKKMFPDTTLTLDEISSGFDRMEADIQGDAEELAILSENREYLRELRYAQNTPCYYLDTRINIHQVAQNFYLMEERFLVKRWGSSETMEERFLVKQEKNFRFEVDGITMFVENIQPDFGEPELWERFSEMHPGVLATKICRNPKTKESLGVGYVCFDVCFDRDVLINELRTNSLFKLSLVDDSSSAAV